MATDVSSSGTYAILDKEDTVLMVMVGKPPDLSHDESISWDEQATRYALKVEALRSRDERPFSGEAGHHLRGDFGTVTFGIGYGGGRKARDASRKAFILY